MTTFVVLIVLLGVGVFWAVRVGQKIQALKELKNGMENLKEIQSFDKGVDEETKRQINHSGDNPTVRGPWLRDRK
jgi:hypothetical protein